MNELYVYNTRTRRKERFEPLETGKARMYVCGVTVYDYCHLGHARCYVAFDVVHRYLEYLGYRVTYVQNITDLDDKLINRARETGGDDIKAAVAQLAEKFTAAYFEDMDKLDVLRADHYPAATVSIPRMIEIVSALIDRGAAYESEGDVYFRVRAFPGYGELSGKNLDDLRAGSRVAVGEKKESPLDFALWKTAAPGEPSWPSPWGEGRPGWHIECSAMSTGILGETFDIHGGGQDLIFPHHENERAQSEAFTGKPFARYWLHNGFVTINREKMSKSLGNVFNLRDIFQKYPPRVVRFFLLGQHYRSPVDYSEEALAEAGRALFRLDNCYGTVRAELGDISAAEPDREAMAAFESAMNDDFNTAAALAGAYGIAEELFRGYRKPKHREKLTARLSAMRRICAVLGVELIDPVHEITGPEIETAVCADRAEELIGSGSLTGENLRGLVLCREAARKNRDWDLADRIREYLQNRGIEVMDRPGAPPAAVYYPEQLDR